MISGLAVSGCDVSGYLFVQDTRLHFIAPRPNASIGLPLTVRWSMRGGLPAGERFAVFVDETPVPAGHHLTPGDTQVQTTTATRCVISMVGTEQNAAAHEHELTIVLVNRSLVRVGESEWSLLFKDNDDD